MPRYNPSPYLELKQRAFNVKDFGAVGNGVHDDTTAIQSAINLTNAAGGGVVYVPPGTYIITSTLHIDSNVSFIGAGRNVSILMIPNGADSGAIYNIADTNNGTDIYIAHLTFDGNRQNNTGWSIAGNASYGLGVNATFCVVYDCEFRNVTDNGSGVPNNAGDVSFISCYSHDNGKKGFHSGAVNRIAFIDNHCYNNSIDSGIGMHQGIYETIVIGNFCYSNGTYGIYVGDSLGTSTSNSRRVIVANNQCTDNTTCGIFLNANNTVNTGGQIETIVQGNMCLRNGNGITVTAANVFQIIGNIFSQNNSQGIYITDSNDGVVTGNIVRNNNQTNSTNPAGILLTNGAVSGSTQTTTNRINVSDNIIIDDQATATQTYGVILGGTAPNTQKCRVVGNNIQGGTYSVRDYMGLAGNNVIYGNTASATVDNSMMQNVDAYQLSNSKSIDGSAVDNNTIFRYVNTLYFKNNSGLVTVIPTQLQTATAAATANSGTITTAGFTVSRVSPTAAVTGIILQAGTLGGQEITVINESASANSVTFAASGSNVADGSSDVISGGTARKFVWDTGTSLWYRVQ